MIHMYHPLPFSTILLRTGKSFKKGMIQTNEIITVSGVSGYIDENGTAFLKLEDAAWGLGFTKAETKDGKEYASVRWERVFGYLDGFGFDHKWAKNGFIPENIFYRLAMKANNDRAEAFQGKVADEILPTIRKTGTYSAHPMSQAEIIAAQANLLVEIEKKSNAALESANLAQKQISGAVEALAAPTPVNWQTETRNKIIRVCKENGLSYLVEFGALYEELENQAHIRLDARVRNLKARMKKSGHTFRECNSVSKLHVIANDPALKLAFDGVVRRFAAKYAGKEINS